MKLTRYILFGFALFAFAQTIQAQVTNQYQTSNGVATGKHVSEQNSDGTYTITLETFATGEQTLVTTSTPVDVVLVLDVSGSMVQPKGSMTNVASGTSISYNTIANSSRSYFFRDSDGDYDEIYCEIYNNRYYLYYDYGQGKNYIYNSNRGVTTSTNRPNNAPNRPNATIFTADTNYWGDFTTVTAETSRIKALKEAVCAFIDEINTNDSENNGTPRDPVLGNQIGIVTFSNNYNVVRQLQGISGKVEDYKTAVQAIVPSGGTYAGRGMDQANSQLENYAESDHNKVIVFFTDGDPSDNYAAVGNATSGAYYAKNTLNASVYTVGVFSTSPATNSNTYRYLNNVSSNYPQATVNYGNMNAGTGSDQGYYKDASGNVDLTAIFKSISQGIGGSEETVGVSTQVRDYVTSSFTVPSGTASDATFYTMDIKPDGSGWTNKQTPAGVTLAIGKKTYPDELDADGHPVQRDTVGVTGFDFSADDNWVGLRYPTGSTTGVYAGKKLVIEFKVRANGDATGGTGAATNTSDSGVYIRTADGEYVNVNHYEIPHTNLPLQISIKKDGLRAGESATFEIMRTKPLQKRDSSDNLLYYAVDSNGKPTSVQTTTVTAYPIWVYNALGKPEPDLNWKEDPTDANEDPGWHSWSKVIVTNKSGVNGQTVYKTLKALDAGYIYKVTEDNWGWSYTMTGAGGTLTTSEVEVNPFHFTNEEKADAVKHAEAVMINHFQGKDGQTSRTEHAKSSKVERF